MIKLMIIKIESNIMAIMIITIIKSNVRQMGKLKISNN